MELPPGAVTASGQVETHELYSTGRRRQIDYVFVSLGMKTRTSVLEDFKDEVATDHWAIYVAWTSKAR
eukprot:12398499-Karenia_brevis.AAC.1